MIIGLTGGIGSGKTTVAKMFSSFSNVEVYIADKEAKKLMNTSIIIKEQLISEFGSESFIDNKLNRNHISNIVFNNKNKLHTLNSIVHPVVRKHFQDFVIKHQNKSYIVYEAAILFESKADVFCDKVISVFSEKNKRIERVMKRDSISELEVKSRMNNQWKENKKILLSNYVIYNLEMQKTALQVHEIHNILT